MKFITTASAAVSAAFVPETFASSASSISLPALPYGEDALEPLISASTVRFHYGKHHNGYVATLNKLIDGTPHAGKSLTEIIRASRGEKEQAVYNNAAQIWNHTFYWESLAPEGKSGVPCEKLAIAIARDFGSLDVCKAAITDAAIKRFGSGWAWLVSRNGKLSVESTSNADTPAAREGVVPLLTVDVWEHAYYLDWQNRRADYVKALVNQLINWQNVSARYAGTISAQ